MTTQQGSTVNKAAKAVSGLFIVLTSIAIVAFLVDSLLRNLA